MAYKGKRSVEQGKAARTNDDPPSSSGSDEGQTTGRYIVIFREDVPRALAGRTLSRVAGLSHVAAAADYEDSAAVMEEIDQADGLYFGSLGIAVVTAAEDSIQSLAIAAADEASPILAIEPEYRLFALSNSQGLSHEYLRGYRDAVNHLFEVHSGRSVDVPSTIASSASFQDTDKLTWGLQATRVHTSKFTGKDIKIAVLDTGMDLHHPDFVNRTIVSKSFISGQLVQDAKGHGTHCVGTSCGPAAPATGVRRYGVATDASIYVGKVLNDEGSGSTGGIIAGIEWALTNGCQIVSMSLGGEIDQKAQQYEVPIRRALDRGLLVIAAAGNNANRAAGNFGYVSTPANADAAMAVASVDFQLNVANTSARSSTVTAPGGRVNIAAPGVRVFSSVPTSLGIHGFKNGTSMATPHVAGIAALWCEATGEKGAKLWKRLEQSVKPLALPTEDIGLGIVQAPQ